jgi:hypothetical protein
LLHTDLVPLKRYRPKTGQIVLGSLSLVNLCAGIATFAAPRPNVGTMTFPNGLLSYVGVVTLVACPLAILKKSQPVAKLLVIASFLVLAVSFLISLWLIVVAWLPSLLAYYQPWLLPTLLVVIGSTVWLGWEWRRLSRSGNKQLLLKTIFFLAVTAEATAVYLVANLLLLLVLGLALNP